MQAEPVNLVRRGTEQPYTNVRLCCGKPGHLFLVGYYVLYSSCKKIQVAEF